MKKHNHNTYMLDAIQLSMDNIKKGGGPFGAVIVLDGKIISAEANSVTNDNDPTAHAEVNAIRKACKVLNTYDLSGCIIYTSCEPCPMCLGAIYWSHISKVFYGNSKSDAMNSGFDDSYIYNELKLPLEKRQLEFEQILSNEALKSFKTWDRINDKTKY